MAKKKVNVDEASAEEIQALLADPETENKKGLRQKLSAMLTEGALPCAKCGTAPHGMLKTPVVQTMVRDVVGYEDADQDRPLWGPERMVESLPVYEVGCIVCIPTPKRGRGDMPSSAVARWNTAQQQKD